MTSFADLPNELVLRILEFTPPSGFESLTCICKDVYQLAEPLLQEHRRLKREYTNLESPASPNCWLAELFISIRNKPCIGPYTTHLHLTRLSHYPWLEETGDDDDDKVAYSTKLLETLESVFDVPAYINDKVRDEWMAMIRKGNEEPILALLLLELPNLQHFSLDVNEGYPPAAAMRAIYLIDAADNWPYLSNLKTVEFNDAEEKADNVYDFIHIFMSIPSVVCVRFESSDADYTCWEGEKHPWGISNVTELVYNQTFIDDTSLDGMIGRTRNLTSLSFQLYLAGNPYSDYQFDFDVLIESLAKHAGHSLESLKLQCYHLGKYSKPLTSLRNLQCLREFRVDQPLLFNLGPHSVSTWAYDLPHSLEKLVINLSSDVPDDIQKNIDNFCQACECLLHATKEGMLPDLKEIELYLDAKKESEYIEEQCKEAFDSIRDICSCAGLMFRFDRSHKGWM